MKHLLFGLTIVALMVSLVSCASKKRSRKEPEIISSSTNSFPQNPSPADTISFPRPLHVQARQGPLRYRNGSYDWIDTAGGPIDLNHVQVLSGVKTDRDLVVSHSSVAGLRIGGGGMICNSHVEGTAYFGDGGFSHLEAFDTTFYHTVSVNGNVTGERCHFMDDLEARAQFISLTSCDTKSIYIYISSPNDLPVVQLKANTIVDGDIVFDTEKGYVVVDETSSVKGFVHGGIVTTEPFPCVSSY
jgi:hypothetical protein